MIRKIHGLGMYGILALAGMALALFGFFALSQATMGVGMLAAGIFLAALARIVQADHHHWKTMQALNPPTEG